MYLIGDIGNTETKICLFNKKKKVVEKENIKHRQFKKKKYWQFF